MAEKKIISNIPEPSWLKEVASDSCLNIRDIEKMFSIKQTTLENLIKRNEFPEPDIKHIQGRLQLGNYIATHKRLWKVITIRKYFKENKENGNS
jgi:hypothetical protein